MNSKPLGASDAVVAFWKQQWQSQGETADCYFQYLHALFVSGQRAQSQERLAHWLLNHPDEAHARYLNALFKRYELQPVSEWGSDYQAGFACGYRAPAGPKQLPQWHPELTTPCHLLVWGEQGIGDQIRGLGWLASIRPWVESLSLALDPKLVPLAKYNFPDIAIYPLPKQDWSPLCKGRSHQLSLGELQAKFWMKTNKQPHSYLSAPALPSPLPVEGALKVGLCYRSGQRSLERNLNYAPLEDMAELKGTSGVRFYSAQYDKAAHQIAEFNEQVGPQATLPNIDLMDDIQSAAAYLSSMDLLVSASTYIADLAPALGVETWRFQHGCGAASEAGPHNPWYGDKTRMYYRAPNTPWPPLFRTLQHDLQQWVQQQ